MGANITKELERELVISPRPSISAAAKSIRKNEHASNLSASSGANKPTKDGLDVDHIYQQSGDAPSVTKGIATPTDLVHVLLSEDVVEDVLLFLHPWDISGFLGTSKENSKMAYEIWKLLLRGLIDQYVEIPDNSSAQSWKVEAYKAYRRKNLQRPIVKTNKDDVNDHFDEYSPFKSILCTIGKRQVCLQGSKPIALGRGSYRILWRVYPISRNCRLTFTAHDAKKGALIHTLSCTPLETKPEPTMSLLDRLWSGSTSNYNDEDDEDKPTEVIDFFYWRIMSSGKLIEVPAEGMNLVAKLDVFGVCLIDYFEIQVVPLADVSEKEGEKVEVEKEEEEDAKGIGGVAHLVKSLNHMGFSRAA